PTERVDLSCLHRAADPSEPDAGLRLHAGREMVLHQRHLGHEIGRRDEVRLGVAAGDDHMQPWPARGERRDDASEVEILIAQRDVELVEDHEIEALVGHELERLRPGALGRRDIPREVLRLPGESFAHRMPCDLLAERGQSITLGRVPGALDELHDADTLAAADHAQGKPERRRGFSLAGPRMNDEEPFLHGLAGDLGVLHGLALGHLAAVAGEVGVLDGLAHGGPFAASGKPATIRMTRSARAAKRWLRRPCRSRKRRASALSGTIPSPTSFDTKTTGDVRASRACSMWLASASTSAPA